MTGHVLVAAASSSSSVGDLIVKIATAIGLVLAAWQGLRIKSRANDDHELQSLRGTNRDLKSDVLTLQGYAFSLQQALARQGIEVPPPPELRTQIPSAPETSS